MIDLEARRADLTDLKTADAKAKPAGFDADTAALVKHYEDSARGLTVARLRELGVGIDGNNRPLEVSLVRWVVDQLAVAYASPPTRWVLGPSRKRRSENSADHKAMIDAYERSSVDLAWREIDRLRALCRQVVVRLYPIDEVGRVELRVFTPDLVMRAPSPAVGSALDFDRGFALQLAGDVLEVWSRSGDRWISVWADENGKLLDDAFQPFAETGHVAPYDALPCSIVYDGYSGGRPYLAPRAHRLAVVDAVNMLANELMELVRTQAHSQRVFTGVEAEDLPRERGPGIDLALRDADARGQDLTPNPKISEASDVLTRTIRDFLATEGLPVDAMEAGRQILTGAGLRTQLRGLIERRKGQLPLAQGDERSLWHRYRSVHNHHADTWGVDQLPDVDLDVELAPLSIPVDEREVIEVGARGMALGTMSRVDLTMQQLSLTREQAIRKIQQVDQDLIDYPAPVAPKKEDAEAAGPRTTSTAPDAATNGQAGVIDAMRDAEPAEPAEPAEAN